MSARQSGEDFLRLARKLRETKLSQSTAVALLDEALARIDCLTKALGDQETELARERHGRSADFAAWAGLTAAGYPAEGETAGDAPPPEPCATCGEPTSFRCQTDLAHDTAVPVCLLHGVITAGPDGDQFDCLPCHDLPPRAELATSECGSPRDGYRCNASIAHRGLAVVTHAEWRDDGTVAATWPGTRIAYQPEPPGSVVPYLAPVPDLAEDGGR